MLDKFRPADDPTLIRAAHPADQKALFALVCAFVCVCVFSLRIHTWTSCSTDGTPPPYFRRPHPLTVATRPVKSALSAGIQIGTGEAHAKHGEENRKIKVKRKEQCKIRWSTHGRILIFMEVRPTPGQASKSNQNDSNNNDVGIK